MARLTTNSQEASIGDLFSSGTSLFVIPFFQREYRWKADKIKNLLQDILNVVDGESDKHFLGAIIIHGRRATPTDPKCFEVIDGQQRMTTIFLFLCALVKSLAEQGSHEEAARIARNYLVTGQDFNQSNLRVHSCRQDRAMMRYVIDDLKSNTDLVGSLSPFNLNALPAHGPTTGAIKNNFNAFKRFFAQEFAQSGIERIREIYNAVFESFTLVQIDVLDPTDGPKIF